MAMAGFLLIYTRFFRIISPGEQFGIHLCNSRHMEVGVVDNITVEDAERVGRAMEAFDACLFIRVIIDGLVKLTE